MSGDLFQKRVRRNALASPDGKESTCKKKIICVCCGKTLKHKKKKKKKYVCQMESCACRYQEGAWSHTAFFMQAN